MIIAACLLAPAFVGCGECNDQEAARTAVDSYLKAFSRGDGEEACDLLTETARDYVTGMAGTVGAKDCPGAFERVRKVVGKTARNVSHDTKIKMVDIQGTKAKVTMTSRAGDAIADLEKVGDEWKISSLPKS
jgi:ketosteroid isomerase-like protein